jgi:hypothetical protein
MKNFSDKVVEKTKNTHFMCNIFYFVMAPLKDNVEKYSTARQVTDINMEHVHCMLAI